MQNSVKRTIFISKLAVYLAVILWIFSAFNFFTKNKVDSEETIVQAFTNASLLDTAAKVSSVSEYKGTLKSISEQEKMLKDAAAVFGFNNYQVMTNTSGDSIRTTLTFSRDKLSAILGFTTKGEKQYISMEINLPTAVDTAFNYKKKMENALKNMGVSSTVKMYFQGSVRGNVKLETRYDIAMALLGDMKAKVMSENKSMECFNIYAYARDIEEYMHINGDKVNVNLSMSYDEILDKTFIYLAVPMNNEDF